ncbi:hypothetical protein QE152_g16891 [Popillia japonica]|uniref:Receptor ligand binding region domain-containing protein n=1 Tax=Popillia japonica TaxID=7064 RepID=A0AAW1L3A2_POPJA
MRACFQGSKRKRVYIDFCGDDQRTLQLATVNVANTTTSTTPVIASLEPELCSAAHVLAAYQNVSLNTWNCPQGLREEANINSGPSLAHVARAFALMVANMKWKSIAIVSTGE